MDLPAELRAALDRVLESSRAADLARIAERQSDAYRNRAPGAYTTPLVDADDEALAYAAWRMPATYGAVARALDAISERLPEYAPSSQLDLGSGPGTAIWAAWARMGPIDRVVGLEQSAAFRGLADELMGTASEPASPAVLYDAPQARCLETHLESPATWPTLTCPPSEASGSDRFDLVTLCYVTGEVGDAAREALVERAWEHCRGVLLIVEPGTTAGHRRLMALRDALVLAGGHVVAPCPHAAPCPLAEGDWCHFAERVARSRVHRRVKGVDLGYEDEKYAYLAVARRPPATSPRARVLRAPAIHKARAEFSACTADGLMDVVIPRREKPRYRLARKLRAGDLWADDAAKTSETGEIDDR